MSAMQIYIPNWGIPDAILFAIYLLQFKIYIVLLAICMLIIWFPIRRLRMTSIISQVNRNRNKHIFRSVMNVVAAEYFHLLYWRNIRNQFGLVRSIRQNI